MAEATMTAMAGNTRSGKTAMMVAIILLVEAVAIISGFRFFAWQPAEVSAVEMPVAVVVSEQDKIVETLVLNAKMPNNKSGVTYLYPTEIYVQVKKRHAERVKAEIDQFQNEIKAEVNAIWRSAEPQHFQEPKLETLTRKVYALLDERFTTESADREPIIKKVVIVMSTGFRIDS